MTPEQFVDKWRGTKLTEKAASHEHFIDLCRVLGEPTPAEADPAGHDYCFEKSVYVVGAASKGSKGDSGFVDVWKRGCFAWEYKRQGHHKDLSDAYRQVYQYRDALDNPPLTIVSDIDTIEIRTHFSGYPTERKVIHLPEIPGQLDTLRRAFRHPETFRPFKSRATVTIDAANEFGKLADSLIDRFTTGRNDPAAHNVAHFLMKLMFCLFVEDIELLPGQTFTRLVNRSLTDPESFPKRAGELFQKMREGGDYGNEVIPWFNGGLFDDAPPMQLKHGDIMALQRIAQLDWGGVEPSIFGTLFERILDPAKRAQIGAHYTSKDDIMLVIEPVIMQPLRRQWATLQQDLKSDLDAYLARPLAKRRGHAEALEARLDTFRQSLGQLRVLDPACGSGNFLYVALQQLLDFDEEITRFATRHGIALAPLPLHQTPPNCTASRSTPTPPNWPRSSSGSATSNGCRNAPSISPTNPSSTNSNASKTATPSSTSPTPKTPPQPNGRKRISSSETRRSWDRSNSGSTAFLTITSKRCSPYIRCRIPLISAVTGSH